jgi:hypothetical protein
LRNQPDELPVCVHLGPSAVSQLFKYIVPA